jgi:hypothetical protein
MQTVYYIPMRKNLASVVLLSAAVCHAAQDNPPTSKVLRAPYIDSHEGMTVGVDPWTTASRYKEKFSKKSPFAGGIVALYVTFRNESDKSVKVDLERIRLLVQVSEDERQELEPLSADDVADVVLLKPSTKDPTARRLPLPVPVPKPKSGRDSNWTSFRDTCQNAAVPSSIVASHSTVAGLVYFDIRGEVDLLQTARFYVPHLVTMGDNQPISYFDIGLGRTPSD